MPQQVTWSTVHPVRLLVAFSVLLGAYGAGCSSQPSTPTAGNTPATTGGVDAATATRVAHPAPAATSQPVAVDPVIARIRDEGLNRSQVMDTLSHLCDVIGPRLTASPSAKRANEWTRNQLEEWGLANAHLEAWGPFGRGWSLDRFSIEVVEPYSIRLNGYPKAWSPGFASVVSADVVYVDATKDTELDAFKGKLQGKVVLLGAKREVEARFEPLATRATDEELARLASAEAGATAIPGQPRTVTASERRAELAASGGSGQALLNRSRRGPSTQRGEATSQPTTRAGRGGRRGFDPFASRALHFAQEEGALLVITPSTRGDGGTLFVQGASVPESRASTTAPASSQAIASTPPTATTRSDRDTPARASTQAASASIASAVAPATAPTTRPRVWDEDAPKIIPQVALAIEDYNRLARMLKLGETIKVEAELRVRFHSPDGTDNCFNTIAEIPGTDPDLKDEIVMVGAHLDSWHSGTGATDNAVGSAAAMEAVRIIRALDLKPRRTIRVALWTGEEQGLLGSTAYVKKHFAHDPDAGRSAAERLASAMRAEGTDAAAQPTPEPASRPARRLVKEPDYENISVYFNLDNGTGRIRGIYAQNNTAAAELFRKWLVPFHDLGAKTVTLANTGSTDHVAFDRVGLPGFQFIQDTIEYNSRTHHSNQDNYDRIQAEDMKQAATIMAAFVWEAANMDERFPRKPQQP